MPNIMEEKIQCPNCSARHCPTRGELSDGVYYSTCTQCAHSFKFRAVADPKAQISFTLNGKAYTIGNSYLPTLTLNDFIRDVVGLTGTKVMCRAGNCGCCMVSVKFYDNTVKRPVVKAINSCLCPLYSCDGWEITTTEGIGSKHDGFHPIQEKIADYNGSQCGWCTPGMVMSMYSHIEENPHPTKAEVEKALDGNICRCTGFRSILDGFQTFCSSSPQNNGVSDLEDLCKQTGQCQTSCTRGCKEAEPIMMSLQGALWYKPKALPELLALVERTKTEKVKLVVGNSSLGFSKDDSQVQVFIDLKGVAQLHDYSITGRVYFGACVTLSHLIDLLKELSSRDGYQYCQVLSTHLLKVASTSVRNMACWAGNLMSKHGYKAFVSDVFTIFSTVGAKLTIASGTQSTQDYFLEQFIDLDMTGKVILSMSLPQMSSTEIVKTFKIMPRAEFALAYVNAGFHFNFDSASTRTIKSRPSLVYGGVSDTKFHAEKTEDFLTGKSLVDSNVLQGALRALKSELQESFNLTNQSGGYKLNLAVGLFYKFVLSVCGNRVAPSYRSGGLDLERPLSTGIEDFDTDKSKWPLTEPMPKLAGKQQASGEALYVPDIHQGELVHAAFVLTTVGNAKIHNVDPSEALAMPGVMRYISAADIPEGGQNNFALIANSPEQLFCDADVLYAGQAVGLIVADTHSNANLAAKKVKVTYTDQHPPIIDIRDAIARGSFFPSPAPDTVVGDPDAAVARADKKLSGEVAIGTQYHMTMETQSCLSIPKEDGYHVFTSTQSIDQSQQSAAQVIGINNADVYVEVKRLGGGYGGKITRNFQTSSACVLASSIMRRPVKMHMDLNTNMSLVGKRFPYLAKYEVGVNNDGKLQGLKLVYYCDCGCSPNDNTVNTITFWADNAYYCENWRIHPVAVKTHTPCNSYCRAPGSTPGIFIMESIMENVAHEFGMDPLQFKAINLYQRGQVNPLSNQPLPYCNLSDLVEQLKVKADIPQRKCQIEQYNKTNRWRKRGLSVVPMKYAAEWDGGIFNVFMSVSNGDGSITICHGGIEMGQGINTKVIQVCAYELGVAMEKVKVRPSDSNVNANSQTSGGSIASELCCKGVIECCKMLKVRLEPLLTPGISWPDLVKKGFSKGVDLSAKYWVYPETVYPSQYQTYGVTCTEVELDVLTGQNQVTRVDMLYDCGESMNPEIDMGQAQGAFVMGLGLYLLEETKYDPQSGANTTNTTWNYHPPSVKDIPTDFRISFLKNTPNPLGVLGAKLVAEPPLCMSCSVLFALQKAIASVREDQGSSDWFEMDAPCTYEHTLTRCLPDINQYTFGK